VPVHGATIILIPDRTCLEAAAAESDAYFAMGPPGSRIGAPASQQSVVIPSRASLESRFRELAGIPMKARRVA